MKRVGRLLQANKLHAFSIVIMLCICACALVFTGCECCGGVGDPQVSAILVSITAPADMAGQVDADWTASWTGGTEPYTVAWDFGGGAEPDTVTGTASAMSHTCTVNMLNESLTDDASHTATLTVTDSTGMSGSGTVVYAVGPWDREAPVITSAIYTEPLLTVAVSSGEDGAVLTVNVTVPEGLAVDAASKIASQTGPLTATFVWHAADMFTGGSGMSTVTVTDEYGLTDTTTVEIVAIGVVPLADTIFAVPLQPAVSVNETATIIVVTGPTANPFHYLVGCNVTYPTWVHYVADSEDPGIPGGGWDVPDGVWGPGGVDTDTFLTGPEPFIFDQEKSDFGIDGRHRYETSIVPLGGNDVTGISGALFNFEVEFDQAGTAAFGFIEAQAPIDRTYYRDGSNNDYYWGTLAAGPDGVNTTSINNEIVVN